MFRRQANGFLKGKERIAVTLYKRGNVWWEYFYIDGIRHQYSTNTNSRRLAEPAPPDVPVRRLFPARVRRQTMTDTKLHLVIVHNAAEGTYSLSKHNQASDEAKDFIEKFNPHMKPG